MRAHAAHFSGTPAGDDALVLTPRHVNSHREAPISPSPVGHLRASSVDEVATAAGRGSRGRRDFRRRHPTGLARASLWMMRNPCANDVADFGTWPVGKPRAP